MCNVKMYSSSLPAYDLALADGSQWTILAQDKLSENLVVQFSKAMRLNPHRSPGRELRVVIDGQNKVVEKGDSLVCRLRPFASRDELFIHLVQLSLVIARDAQKRGGVLLHGALAELNGQGVILAGPSGAGKTTASRRLPPPWRSLCDDTTLVVRDSRGDYWAHPWPTWSQFFNSKPGGSWDTQRGISLMGVFFLAHAQHMRTETIGPGRAISMLLNSADQVSQFMTYMIQELKAEQARQIRIEVFENLCTLVNALPTYTLHLSQEDDFWLELAQVFPDIKLEGTD